MRRLTLGLVMCLAATCAQAQASLQTQQTRAQKDRGALHEQIDALQKRIEASQSTQADASNALRDTEQAISDITRRLAGLQQRRSALDDSLAKLAVASAQQKEDLAVQQKALADQVRAQYASGLSPWSALLSGRDPQAVGRELAYLAYIAQARAQGLAAIRTSLARLDDLRMQTTAQQAELKDLLARTQADNAALREQQHKHQQVLDQIGAQLRTERKQEKTLQARDEQLGRLIRDLDVEIAREEARRKALAEQRAREQAKRAEQARLARQAEQARRRAEQARLAEQARQQAEEARAGAAAPPAGQAQGAGVQQGGAISPADEGPVAGSAHAAPQEVAPTQASPARSMPPGGFAGLQKGLPPPVAGEVQGRFGAQRPDGNIWRGIVLRAAAGTPVRAVAAGRVVYAHWLAGFGNLLILDHGHQYLSIYAYNQALLKQVGDIVARGDTVARVGSTGGQVEPGLYFELRHDGAPINPQLWLRP